MGVITRVTFGVPSVPSTVERLAAWFARSANTRAAASMGNEEAMEYAPNVIPLRPLNRMGKVEAIVSATRLYCRRKHYPMWVQRQSAELGLMRLRHGASPASAIASAIVRADFAAMHGRDPEAA
jgi:hypothetical protein